MRAESGLQFPFKRIAEDVDGGCEGTLNLIVAPHFDDEVIGCFELMVRNWNYRIVPCISEGTTTNRRKELVEALLRLDTGNERSIYPCVHPMSLVDSLTQRIHSLEDSESWNTFICWFPDPDWETHPLHKLVGQIGRFFANEVVCETNCPVLVGFYSVNMDAPYVHELTGEVQNLKEWACKAFASQEGYFKQYQKSWMFEGRYLV